MEQHDGDRGHSDSVPGNPFNHTAIRDWFFENLLVPEVLLEPATTGSGPFEEKEFDDFLLRNGITPSLINSDTDLLVIGREEWDQQDLDALLDTWRGRRLRIYSQEMYLAYWATEKDPLESPEAVTKAFRQGHPALEYVCEGWQGWVSTSVSGSGSGTLVGDWPQKGLLSHMHYHVGVSFGVDTEERRVILRTVFHEGNLPQVKSVEYMDKWGTPHSAKRLEKLADCLAAFCRNAKKKDNEGYATAIADWEADLAWLKKTFYDGRFSFPWPGDHFQSPTSRKPITLAPFKPRKPDQDEQ